jgi:trimeric autotransporter adhesin
MRLPLRTGLVGPTIVVLMVAGCGGSSSSSPSSPSTSSTPATSTPTVSSVTVSGVPSSITTGQTAQLSATATLSNGTAQTVTGTCTWSSSNTVVATVNASGFLTASGAGDADIRCTYQSASGSATVHVSAPAVTTTSLSVTGVSGDLRPSQTMQLTATATLSTGATQNVTTQATWTTSSSAVATVSGTGLVTAVAVGDADIRAAYQGLSATVRVRVVTPAPATYCLDGVVTEKNRGVALQAATAQVTGGPSGTTGSDGRYTLCGLSGTITVRVSATGYANQEFTLTLTANTSRNVTLTPSVSNSSADICNVSGSVRAECGTASAFCKDGWYSCSQNRSGTCSSHGGVQCWLCPGALCNPFLGLGEANWTPAGPAVCSATRSQ